MFKLSFYVPETYLKVVKSAVFEAGAGRYQNYELVSWQVLGQGQFMPKSGSLPFSGHHDTLECVKEYRVEMLCEDELIEQAITALVAVHPYEAPAYEAWKVAYSGSR